MAAVALAVAAIPEGLPAAVTIILAIGVARMARRNALVRRLPAVETLGSTTVICTDKTGTLTKNEMTVQQIATVDAEYSVTDVGYGPEGEIVPVAHTEDGAATEPPVERADARALRECLLAGLLCNDARLVRTDHDWAVEGDPTEAALVVAARKLGLDEADAERWARLDVLPFQSEHQYMATLHDVEGGQRIAYVKGAVERLLPRCANALDARGAIVALAPEHVKKAAERMTQRALRVLAVARLERDPDASSISHADLEAGLTFLGIVGMIDPPRPEAIAAVRACHTAGIDVKMITGDHAGTAVAIAMQLGIGHGAPVAANGAELGSMSDDMLAERLPRTNVFARVTPEHKLRIVRALQRAGHVVAMTGDGVNDAPALRQADIGVAMGKAGTDVAKESAYMVLTDDNFASIAAAVEEGRGVFDNLRTFIVWTIPTNVGQGLVVIVALAAGAALPILPLQILWINMTTAILLGTPLAFEPTERDVMVHPPRDPKSKLLTSELVQRSGLVGLLLLGAAFGLYEWELGRGASLEEARTVAATAFSLVQALYLLSCRSLLGSVLDTSLLTNLFVWVGTGAMLARQIGFVYAPAMNDLFGSAALPPAAWLRLFGVAAAAFAVIEVEKGTRRFVLRARRRARKTAAASA
jgi:Ca2+-transporting ATPase